LQTGHFLCILQVLKSDESTEGELRMAGVRNSKKYTQQMVERIATQFQPDKIILFGSHAQDGQGWIAMLTCWF
jgi:hypothetical protein